MNDDFERAFQSAEQPVMITPDRIIRADEGMSDFDRAMSDAARASMQPRTINAPVETQRVRTTLSGLTLGFADELEAAARSMFESGRSYEEIRNDIRDRVKAYQAQNPGEAFTLEMLGAAAPTVAALFIPGGQPVAAARTAGALQTAKTLAGRGAIEGGLAAYGTGEQGVIEDIARVPTGAALGAGFGATTGPLMQKGGELTSNFTNWVRSKMGDRLSGPVEAEVRRLVNETGLTPDEVIMQVQNGQLMTENETLIKSLRAYTARGGEPGAAITGTIQRRAEETRSRAMDRLQQGLAPSAEDNVYRSVKMSEDAFKQKQSRAYTDIFKNKQEVSQETTDILSEAMVRLPDARNVMDNIYKARGNLVPFYKVADDGSIRIVRQPTVEDAELIRRALAEQASDAFKAGRGSIGEPLSDLETRLRSRLDAESPELSQTRQNWRYLNTARDAFKLGRSSLGKNADEIEVEFQRLVDSGDEGAVKAFRAGVMDSIRNKARRSPGIFQRMADENSQEGTILRIVYPEDQIDDVIRNVSTAGKAQRVKQKVLDGSPTSQDIAAGQRIGDYVSAGDVTSALAGDIRSMARVGSNLIRGISPELTEKQRMQVVDIVMSEDPDVLRRAFFDESAIGRLQAMVSRIIGTTMTGAQIGGMRQAGEFGGNMGILDFATQEQ